MPQKQQTPEDLQQKRVVRFILTRLDFKIDPALQPTDKWLFETMKDMVRTNRSLQKHLALAGGLAAATLGGLGALGYFGVAALVAGAAATALAVGGGALALAGAAAGGGYLIRRSFMKNTAPALKETFGKRVLKYQADLLASAFRKRLQEKRQAKQAAGADRGPQAKAIAQDNAPDNASALNGALSGLFRRARAAEKKAIGGEPQPKAGGKNPPAP